MASTSLLCTGLSGLVGSKFRDDFNDSYDFYNLDISDENNPVDITNKDQVQAAFEDSAAPAVIHLAAFTNVTAAHEQDGETSGLAYQVNVVGTENILSAAEQTGKHVIHISTAYVFDGEKEGLYTEEDERNPIEWYGKTKALAEERVEASKADTTILRIDFPFRSDPFPRPDIVRKLIESAEKGYPLFTNHYFGPTFIDDFAKVLDWVVRTKTTGLFNANAGEQWSDYELALLVNEQHNLGLDIQQGNLDEYLKNVDRPYQRNTAMSNQKLVDLLDFKLTSIAVAAEMVSLD